MKLTRVFAAIACLAPAMALADTSVEIKLIEPFEEDRGWCLDLRGGQPNAQPIGGLHGHTCYTYQRGVPSRDQGFVKELIETNNEFRMVEFNDLCMTLYEPSEGSFVSVETCDGRETQAIMMDDEGHIMPEMAPELCLTLGTIVLPGGGGNPLHIMRDLTFEGCDSTIDERQKWELRAEYNGPEETSAERTYKNNPNAAPPGGGGGGMGMGMGAGMGDR